MTDSPSDVADAPIADDTPAGGVDLSGFAAELSDAIGGSSWTADFDTVKVTVPADRWVEAITKARDSGLVFFSWLSAVDWAAEVAVGEGVDDAETVEERYEVLCRLSNVTDASAATIATNIPKDDAALDSLVPVFGGAEWHEREAAEMFGIDFRGHPNLVKIYLPDGFEGHPLRKDYPLLSREVKPWPGTVDVEGMPDTGPSTENPEAGE
ncbi:MAG: NADH-quinone oxidoreductase subunit C [Acidimicrobiia bacterium]|nr:NADH-quinone oxidoreductase subunit C [Acidimicrobiia bacterium]